MNFLIRWFRVGVWLLAILTGLAVSMLSVSAHAELESSAPIAGSALTAAPNAIELRFTETVDADLSSISMIAADGDPIALGPASLDSADKHILRAGVLQPSALAPGVYTVVWGAYSAEDGHASSGSYTVSVGTGEAPSPEGGGLTGVSSWAIAGKWLELVGFVLLTGFAVFRLTSGFERAGAREAHRYVLMALPAMAIVGALLSLRAREVTISGASIFGGIQTDTVANLLDCTYGTAWLVRLVTLVSALMVAWWLARDSSMRLWAVLAGCGAIGLATLAVSGHSGAVDSAGLAASVDFVHMAGASVWLGGLLGLLLTLSPMPDSQEDRKLLHRQGNRFAAAVVVLALTGVASAWWHIDGRRSLLQTDYGQTLLLKVGIVAGILGIAWYNRRVLQAIPGRPRWIPLAVGAELVLGLVVLLFSADLSQTPPANQPLAVQVAAPNLFPAG